MTTDPNLPYVVGTNWGKLEELEANLAGIPHTILSRPILCPTGATLPPYLKDCIRRVYSPDGQYYFQQARHPDEQHQIKGAQPVIFESQTDERVAHMYKWNWWLRELGWAGDSSGAYFEVISKGEVWDRELEAHPIYKLLVPGATPGPPLKEVALPSFENKPLPQPLPATGRGVEPTRNGVRNFSLLVVCHRFVTTLLKKRMIRIK